MSRSYNARRKARRQQARTARGGATEERRWHPLRAMAVVPALVIAATLATVGLLGFGGSSSAVNKAEVQQKVNTLLADIPQQGATLGSPKAPLTLWVFADLECPTVKRFVTTYLPSIIRTWVRNGTLRLTYRSLETDTLNEHTFYQQEVAALAAGRQQMMWNFILTFVHEQGLEYSGYATIPFLADIASQLDGMSMMQWRHDRKEAPLSKQVALGGQIAKARQFSATPSLLIGPTGGAVDIAAKPTHVTPLQRELEVSLAADLRTLREETVGDNPALHRAEIADRQEVEEFGGE